MRWGYTARGGLRAHEQRDPVRHAWDGYPAARRHARLHAECGAALIGLGPRAEYFDPAHPRACQRCVKAMQ
jgi:hypothetical protein